jgi:GDP-L-fucose synthase
MYNLNARVLVTGGTGLLGRSLQTIIPQWVYVGSADCDLTDRNAVADLIKTINPEGIIHLAARVGGIKANVARPAEFFYQNASMNLNVIHEAHEAGVKRLVACLSTCAFPDVNEYYPFNESSLHLSPPTKTNFEYGYAKRLLDIQVNAYRKQYGLDYVSFAPCNIYGPGDNFDLETCHLIPALIVKCLNAINDRNDTIELLGTGAPLRQQLYVNDLAQLIKIVYQYYSDSLPIIIAHPTNLSIREIAHSVARAVDYRGEFLFNGQLDGQYRKDGSIEMLLKLLQEEHIDFEFTPLDQGLQETVNWYLSNVCKK